MNDPGTHAQPMLGVRLQARDVALALMLAVFSYACAWLWITTTPAGVPPDEYGHLTYIHEIAAEGRIVPDYAGSRRLPHRTRPNYLNHPPLYYTTMGLAGRVMGWDAIADVRAYRALSAGFVALGIMLWILSGRIAGLSPVALIAVTAALHAIPMFPYLAGSINNDNLAFLGVAIAFHGLLRLRRGAGPPMAYYIAALGVAIAMLTKATAALFLCACFAAWALPQLRDPSAPIRSRHFVRALLIAGVAVGGYYGWAVATHGTVFPVATEIYSELTPPRDPLGLLPFAATFAKAMTARLATVMSFGPLYPITPGLRPLFYLMLALPLVAWLAQLRPGSPHPQRDVAWSFMLGLLTTIVVHVWVTWSGYREHGLFAGIQPRYYSYALPGLFIFAFLQLDTNRGARLAFGGFALMATILVALMPPLTLRAESVRAATAEVKGAQGGTLRVAPPASSVLTLQADLSPAGAGHVDRLRLSGGRLVASGWAIDRADRSPAPGVLILLGDRIIGRTTTGQARPDVARSLRTRAATASGFSVVVDDVPTGTQACDMRFAAEQGDGSFALLRTAACSRRDRP